MEKRTYKSISTEINMIASKLNEKAKAYNEYELEVLANALYIFSNRLGTSFESDNNELGVSAFQIARKIQTYSDDQDLKEMADKLNRFRIDLLVLKKEELETTNNKGDCQRLEEIEKQIELLQIECEAFTKQFIPGGVVESSTQDLEPDRDSFPSR